VKFKGHDEAWGLAQDADYVAHHYHQPSDGVSSRHGLDFGRSHGALWFRARWQAATQARLVGWKKGDEFESARRATQ